VILPSLRALPAGALGLVFIVAGILKAVDPTEFVRQIETYGIVSGSLAVILAYTLLPLEIGLGSALLAGYRARLAAAATVILLLVFMSATAYAWSQGKTEGCGCFGSIASRTPGQVLVEDTGLLGLGILAFLLGVRRSAPARGRGIAVVAAALLVGVVLPLSAYALPLDPLVTELRIGRSVGDLPLREAPVDLGRGAYLVALLDLDAPDSRQVVKRLNAIGGRAGTPAVIAFFGGEVDEKKVFCFNTNPSFEVVAVPRSDLKRLYRKLPRFFQLKDGRVSRIWDGAPPAPEEVL